LKFVDESGVNIAMTRRDGRARRGRRVHDAAPKNWGRNVTVLGSLSCHGLDAVMTVEGATDAAMFRAYVSEVLAPTLKPGDVVVMDNLRAHKVDGIRSAIEASGAALMYLPPYSLDCSPIEQCWSKFKTCLPPACRIHGVDARAAGPIPVPSKSPMRLPQAHGAVTSGLKFISAPAFPTR
jgi:transposase